MSLMGDKAPELSTTPVVRPIHALPVVPLFIVAAFASRSIHDNSFLWHIRAGAVQLASERVITEDVFSFTMLGTSWRTQSWLAELAYASLERWMVDLVWVSVMVFLLGSLSAGLVGLSMYRSSRSPVWTGFAMIATIWLAAPFLQPRPVLISYVLLAALVLVLQNRARQAWLVVPIVWIWSAIHGSWVIGGLLILLQWIRVRDRKIFYAGLSALVTTILTAHGLGVWQILMDFAVARDALELMQEWKAPDFGDIVQAPYLLILVGVIVAAMRDKLAARDLIVILPFLVLGMMSRRTVFPAAIVLAPWAAYAFPPLRIPRSSISSRGATVVVASLSVLVLSTFVLQPLGALDHEQFPTQPVVDAIAGTRAFHDDAVGGYLIYRRFPDDLVFFDDRAELYGAEMITEYNEARQGRFHDVFDKYDFETAIARKEWPLADALRADGWTEIADDATFVVFTR